MVDVRAFRVAHGLDPDGGATMSQVEVIKVLRWSAKRVRRWTVAGRIPHDREHDGGWPVYPVAGFVAWLEHPDRSAA